MKVPRYLFPLGVAGTAVGVFVLIKDWSGVKYEGDERIAGRAVIVTGANSGIGKETARELAKRGGKVILACRDLEKCEHVKMELIEDTFNRNIHCRKLDLGSIKSIKEFAKITNETETRIDILINNAGVMLDNREVTEDGFEKHLGVNYLGHFLLTNLLLEKLIASAPSRVVNVASIGYSTTRIPFTDLNGATYFNSKDAYKQSKLAVVMFTHELSKRLQNSGVTVNAVQPGLVETELRRHFPAHKSYISGTILKPIWMLAFKTPVQGAQTTIHCALDTGIAGQTGKMFSECTEVNISADAMDEEKCKRLWAISEKWTRLKE